MLHVIEVAHRGEYNVRVTFNNGVVKDVDLRAELHGEVFEPLRDPEYFARVRVSPETGTIEWPNGADFAPEFLFDTGEVVGQMA
ncbi:MAG: DUF2442 domain-containing protein [Gemmatimonadota bacterium]